MDQIPEPEGRYLRAAFTAAGTAREFLEWMEHVGEALAPERSADLAAQTRRAFGERLPACAAALASPPEALAPFAERFRSGFEEVTSAFEQFTTFPSAPPRQRIARILAAIHHVARAQEAFYDLRRVLTPFAGYWELPGSGLANEEGPEAGALVATGIVHVSPGSCHGGVSLYVPERYTPERAWPVIIALHGGSGNGRDFLWTWVREARSLGYIVAAPSAVADTWGPLEERGLLEIIAWLSQRYHVARDRILLTGLSDGATFGLLYGLARPDVYRALAPLCGVLHPAHDALGNLERARGVPIYLVHGALDFLFPVIVARAARDILAAAGAALEYRELPELSHTYPRSENVRILSWFAGLPPRSS